MGSCVSKCNSVNAGFRESAQLFEAEIKKSEKAVETSEHFHHDSNLLSITDETTQKLEKTGVWNSEIITGNEQTNFFSPELQQIISTESLQDQINKELKMLRIQVARNQLLLSSLQSKSGKISFAAASEEKNNHSSYMPIADDVAVDELTSERNVHWSTQMNFSLHSKTKGLQRYSSRATSSSQSSTPQHFHSRSRSCPILPSQTSFVTKGTQTEPLNTVDHSQNPPNTIQLCHSNMAQILLQQTPITSIADNKEHSSSVEDEISLSSSPALLMLRNRSYSFAQAITQTLRSRNDSSTETNNVVESNNLQKHSSHNSSSANIYVTQVPSTSSSASSSSSAEESEDIRHNQNTNESSPKKKDITECPSSERQRKTGLTTVTQEPPKMIVTSEHVTSRHEGKKDDDDNEDDSNRRPLSRLGNRRRRRSFGSPTISPAIQRSKAVDFDFDVTDDQLYSLSNSPSTKKDDSDLDIKRDILEGMTQAANYASRCSATSTTETITTSTPVTVSSVTTSRNSDVHEHKLRRRTGDSTKSRLLMPDLMENSETESAKNSGGSMESEAEPPLATTTESSVIMPPPPSGDGAFPSLPDIFLQKLELHSSVKERSEPLTDSEIEIKFNSLCLAFKTDRFTLTSRLELHQRQRDLAEKNITDEINALKENLNVLSQLCSNEESRELMKRLYRHLEVLVKSTTRISSKAELYGAVQQEERTNRAVEAMLMYVENLKRINEKTTTEVGELKRILADNNLLPEEGIESEDGRRRTYSVSSIGIGKPSSRRRASIAALPRSSAEKVDGKTKFAAFVANAASRNSICNIGGRRCSLLPNLRPFSNSDRLNSSDKIKKPFMDDYQLNSSTNNNNSEALEQDVAIREGNSQNHSTVLANVKSDSPAQAPLPLDHLSPVASSSSPSNGNIQLSNAAVTTNVEKRKTALYLNDECQENGSIGFENSPLQVSSNWSQTKLTNTSYMTDASEQDDEDDADIDDRNRIQPEFSSPVIQSSPYAAAASLLDVNHWVHDRVQIISSIRYVLGGMLFLAAIFSLVFTFMPSSTVAAFQCQTSSWNTVEELFRPYLVLHHQARPPM